MNTNKTNLQIANANRINASSISPIISPPKTENKGSKRHVQVSIDNNNIYEYDKQEEEEEEESYSDMANIPHLSGEAILDNVRRRYNSRLIYTYIADILISVMFLFHRFGYLLVFVDIGINLFLS